MAGEVADARTSAGICRCDDGIAHESDHRGPRRHRTGLANEAGPDHGALCSVIVIGVRRIRCLRGVTLIEGEPRSCRGRDQALGVFHPQLAGDELWKERVPERGEGAGFATAHKNAVQ